MESDCCKFITKAGTRCKHKPKVNGLCTMHNKDKCPICFELVHRNSKKLSCNHVFHEECITQWYVTADSCPVCRVSQGKDNYIKFKNLVEDNMRNKYRDAIDSLENEIIRLRREVRILRRRPLILD